MPEQGASWAVFMEDPLSLEQCAGRLERRGFRSFVVPGLREAAEVMRGLVREFRPSSASYGDSMTLKAAGILDDLHSNPDIQFYDGFVPGMVREEPRVTENYIRYLTTRIRFLSSRIDSFVCGGTEQRVLLFLSNNAEQGVCALPYGMDKLAKKLGMSRATLYRAIGELVSEGKLKRDGRVFTILPVLEKQRGDV